MRGNRTLTCSVLFFLICVDPSLVRSQEVMVVDQQCVESKVLACMKEWKLAGKSALSPRRPTCPAGTRVVELGRRGDFTDYECHFEAPAFLSQGRGSVTAEELRTFHETLRHCSTIAEAFPGSLSYVPNDSCLRPLRANELVGIWRDEVRALFKQLCAVSGSAKCLELDTPR